MIYGHCFSTYIGKCPWKWKKRSNQTHLTQEAEKLQRCWLVSPEEIAEKWMHYHTCTLKQEIFSQP